MLCEAQPPDGWAFAVWHLVDGLWELQAMRSCGCGTRFGPWQTSGEAEFQLSRIGAPDPICDCTFDLTDAEAALR